MGEQRLVQANKHLEQELIEARAAREQEPILPSAPSPESQLVETLQQQLERTAQSEMEHKQRLDEHIGQAKDLEQKLLAAMDVEHRLVQANKQLEQQLLEARAAHEQEVALKEQSQRLLQEADDNRS